MTARYFSPPDRAAFNAAVWSVVRRIPAGKVCPYGKIALLLPPLPGITPRDLETLGPRWVGGAMAGCPEDVPWQRVVNAQGKISLSSPAAAEQQRIMLEAEGVEFDARGKIDLSRFGWDGRSGKDEWDDHIQNSSD